MGKYAIKNKESGEVLNVNLDWILKEINRDRSDEWINYNKHDWREGLREFTEFEIVSIKTDVNKKAKVKSENERLKHIRRQWDGFNCYIGLTNGKYIMKYPGCDLQINKKVEQKLINLREITLDDILNYITLNKKDDTFNKILERLEK